MVRLARWRTATSARHRGRSHSRLHARQAQKDCTQCQLFHAFNTRNRHTLHRLHTTASLAAISESRNYPITLCPTPPKPKPKILRADIGLPHTNPKATLVRLAACRTATSARHRDRSHSRLHARPAQKDFNQCQLWHAFNTRNRHTLHRLHTTASLAAMSESHNCPNKLCPTPPKNQAQRLTR